ncbi:MAG: hypothetical protein WC600_13650 [Desulfobaccales bacterium]
MQYQEAVESKILLVEYPIKTASYKNNRFWQGSCMYLKARTTPPDPGGQKETEGKVKNYDELQE